MAVEFYIHKMSEHMDSAEIVEWLVREGDKVLEHQPMIEVMTDKFTVEVEAPATGIVRGIRPGCDKGAVVPVGEPLCYIANAGEQIPTLRPFDAGGATPAAPAEIAPAEVETIARVKSTPVARKMAKDLGVDIEQLVGTGPGGRVAEADIRAFVANRTAPVPLAPLPPAPTLDPWQDLTPIQRITGERMHESVITAPQFALELSVDVTNLLWLCEALDDRVMREVGTRLSLTGLLVKLVAATLCDHPRANAEFSNGKIRLHRDVNVGVAVGADIGLFVPVIKSADRKELAAVASALAAFQEKARTGRFNAEDLSGGTFTVSNLGMFGIERFAAIVNPPQSAILAVGAVVKTPVVLANDTVGIRPRMSLTLTVDHRVMDGLQGARFLADLKEKIEKPYSLI